MKTKTKSLLLCGILSSVYYLLVLIVVPYFYQGYSSVTQTVSEISAVDTPTRTLWVVLIIPYTALLVAFGFGLRAFSRPLKIAGTLIIFYSIIGLFWPPMHQREVLAAGGGTATDTWHIIMTVVWGICSMAVVGLGMAAMNKQFRVYSIVTLIVLLFFGGLTAMDSPDMEANLPTPYLGVWERISMGAYMLWLAVLAALLLRKNFGNATAEAV